MSAFIFNGKRNTNFNALRKLHREKIQIYKFKLFFQFCKDLLELFRQNIVGIVRYGLKLYRLPNDAILV